MAFQLFGGSGGIKKIERFHPPTQETTPLAVDAVVHSHELWRRTRDA